MTDRDYLNHWTPGGAQTRSKRDLFQPVPLVATDATGCLVYGGDIEYLDWMASLASVGLGYRNRVVDRAVKEVIDHGCQTLPLPSLLEGRVAEQLCSVLGWPEQVRWIKTGSEATDGAMLIARAATGRRKIVSIGYHGWHCAHLPSEDLVTVPWGSWDFISEMDCRTAGVLLEPMRDHEPKDGYLEAVRERCEETGALLIMDEIVTGFRWAIGGATEFLKLPPPDLACYGKAMANGYPIAAIVGKRHLMKYASEVSSTFGGEGVGLAAAGATIGVYLTEKVIDHLWWVGQRLQGGVPELQGYPVHPHWGAITTEKKHQIANALAEMGVLTHPAGLNPMYAHTEQDVDRTIWAMREFLDSSEGRTDAPAGG